MNTTTFEKSVTEGLTGHSGTKYLYEPELSAARYYTFQTYILEMSAGQDAASVVANMKRALSALNNPGGALVADASIAVNDCIRGIEDWGYSQRKCVMAVALLFNRESDDYETRVRFDEKDLMEKVEDLEKAYSAQTFFKLLSGFTAGLKQN